jgi:TolB protein
MSVPTTARSRAPSRAALAVLAVCAVITGLSLVACGGDAPITDPAGPAGTRYEIAWATSPGGDYSTVDIALMTADGKSSRSLVTLTGLDESPEWSPDGRTLLFTHRDDQRWSVWSVAVDGSGLHRLDTGPGEAWGASWSPNGEWISFFHLVDDYTAQLDVMRLDGGQRRKIPGLPTDVVGPTSWSRTGRIAFKRFNTSELWTTEADGAGAARLTSTPGGVYRERWSPDGGRIAFMTQVDVDTRTSTLRIAVVNADGSGYRLLSPGPEDDYPSWSPDGQWLLYHGYTRVNGTVVSCSLFKIPSAGGTPVEITTGLQTYTCWGAAWR